MALPLLLFMFSIEGFCDSFKRTHVVGWTMDSFRPFFVRGGVSNCHVIERKVLEAWEMLP